MREKPLFTDENVMKPYIELVARETALSNNRQAVHLSRATSNVIPCVKRPPSSATLATLVRRLDSTTTTLIRAKNALPAAFTIDRITRSPITVSPVAVTRNIIGLTLVARCKMLVAPAVANDELIFAAAEPKLFRAIVSHNNANVSTRSLRKTRFPFSSPAQNRYRSVNALQRNYFIVDTMFYDCDI